MARRTAALVATWLAAALCALAGCAAGSPPVVATPSPATAALTPRAIAAIVADALSPDYSSAAATSANPDDPPGLLGADLRYDASPAEDGTLVRVTAAPATSPRTCDGVDSCAPLAADGGDPVYLLWETAVPEEDPGIVVLWVNRAGETERLLLAGPKITGDPRALRLPFTVDDLRAVLVDPRLRLETTPEAVSAGERIARWE